MARQRPPIFGGVVGGGIIAGEGIIDADDQDAKFIAGDPDEIYTDYEIRSFYEKDRHIYMMPVTSPEETQALDGTVAFVQLAMPTLLWVADWTAARTQTQPEIPDPRLILAVGLGHKGLLTFTSDKNWVLLDDHYEAANWTLMSDGVTPLWRLSGIYVYGHRKPALLTIDDVVIPRVPYVENFVKRRVVSTSLKHNIIDLG